MNTKKRDEILQEFDQFHERYVGSSRLKHLFSPGRTKREFKSFLERNAIDEEQFLRCLASAGRIGIGKDQASLVSMLTRFIDVRLVRLFAYLTSALDDKPCDVNVHEKIAYIFETLSKNNQVSDPYMSVTHYPAYKAAPLWSHPGIPCLLEALIQLISAEKTKYVFYNNQWYAPDCCWEISGAHAKRLVSIAGADLSNISEYKDIPLAKIFKIISDRADAVRNISEDQAKDCANYRKLDGNPPGGYKPLPGSCNIGVSALDEADHVDYIFELKLLMQESGAIEVFRRYLGLSVAV
jgi:hypothetical protein